MKFSRSACWDAVEAQVGRLSGQCGTGGEIRVLTEAKWIIVEANTATGCGRNYRTVSTAVRQIGITNETRMEKRCLTSGRNSRRIFVTRWSGT